MNSTKDRMIDFSESERRRLLGIIGHLERSRDTVTSLVKMILNFSGSSLDPETYENLESVLRNVESVFYENYNKCRKALSDVSPVDASPRRTTG